MDKIRPRTGGNTDAECFDVAPALGLKPAGRKSDKKTHRIRRSQAVDCTPGGFEQLFGAQGFLDLQFPHLTHASSPRCAVD
jgi:hypothetical protein